MTSSKLQDGSLFGEHSRYMLHEHVSHRGAEFNCWMVLDAERTDEVTGGPAVIRQAASIEEAIAGLEVSK